MRIKMKCKNNEVDMSTKDFLEINRIEYITQGDITYCFSCYDIKNQINAISSGYVNIIGNRTQKLNLDDKEKQQLLSFFDNSGCDRDSDDEDSDYVKAITSKDTEPYIEKLGILDKAKESKFSVRQDFGYGDTDTFENLLQYVKEYTTKFFDYLEQDIPAELEFTKIQKSIKSSNIHEAAIKYYEKLYDYFEEFELLDTYAEFDLNNKIMLSVYINNQLQQIDISNVYDVEKKFPDLARLNITSLNGTIFPSDMVHLNLSQNHLKDFDNVHFPATLQNLVVYGNNFETLDGIIFPPSLRILSFQKNKLKSIDFSQFPRTLEEINLSENKITSITSIDSIAEHLPHLKYLVLHQNKIKSFKYMRLPPSLEYLDIRYNDIRKREDLPNTNNLRNMKTYKFNEQNPN